MPSISKTKKKKQEMSLTEMKKRMRQKRGFTTSNPLAEHLGQGKFTTHKGISIIGDSRQVMQNIPDDSIDLIFTSPPFALRKKKKYGNEPPEKYIEWFLSFAYEFKRILKDSGSMVIDIGGSWNPGQPTKSLYHHKLLIALVETVGLHLAQEVFWYNPARLPTPAQWVCLERCRLKDAVNMIWWFGKTERPKSDNRKVLTKYKQSQRSLINGTPYNEGRRPSEHVISDKFSNDNGGAIPPNYLDQEVLENLIRCSNTSSRDPYTKRCKKLDLPVHPARIPLAIPDFFVNFLTDPGDMVLDPFSGSNTTGITAENNDRYWVSIEINKEYVLGGKTRFLEQY